MDKKLKTLLLIVICLAVIGCGKSTTEYAIDLKGCKWSGDPSKEEMMCPLLVLPFLEKTHNLIKSGGVLDESNLFDFLGELMGGANPKLTNIQVSGKNLTWMSSGLVSEISNNKAKLPVPVKKNEELTTDEVTVILDLTSPAISVRDPDSKQPDDIATYPLIKIK